MKLTGTSIQALNCCSSATQPSALCPLLAQHPNTDAIIPAHGFTSALFGRRTRSLGRGGRRGATLTFGVAFGGGMVGEGFDMSSEEGGRCC